MGAAELFTIKCGGWDLKVLAEVLGDGYLRHASWHPLKGIVNESAAGIFLIHNAFFIAEHILGQRKCRRKSAEFAYLRSFFSIFSHVITSQSRYGIFCHYNNSITKFSKCQYGVLQTMEEGTLKT